MKLLRHTSLTLAAAIGLLASSGIASAETNIRASVGLPTSHPAWSGFDAYIDAVEKESDGAIKFEPYPGGSLLSLKATLTGIRDGIADAGTYIMAYWPSEFPHGKLIADLALMSKSAPGTAGAVAEFFLLKCGECQREFKQNKMVFIAPFSTPPYRLISNEKITHVEDLKGKKIRVGGSVWARWAEKFGAIPVSIPGVESYEAMSQGQINATIASGAYLKSLSMWEVADNMTMVDLGTFHSAADVGFGLSQWSGYSEDVRRILLMNGPVAMTEATVKYVEDDLEAEKEAPKHDVSLNQPADDLSSATRQFIEADLKHIQTEAEEEFGVENAGEKIRIYQDLLAKWNDLTAPIGLDRDKLTELYRREIYEKLDAAKYGL